MVVLQVLVDVEPVPSPARRIDVGASAATERSEKDCCCAAFAASVRLSREIKGGRRVCVATSLIGFFFEHL